MSRITEVLKNKNRVEKSQRARRKDELNQLKTRAAFNASLSDEMKYIDTLLSSSEIEYVTIKVPEGLIAKFGEAIYSEGMSGYDVAQNPNKPDEFTIKLRAI